MVDVAFLPTRAAARERERRLAADAVKARTERITERAQDDPERGPLGYLVRAGRFATKAEAVAERTRPTGAGYSGLRVGSRARTVAARPARGSSTSWESMRSATRGRRGSTAMTVGSALVTRPSDPTGERPIADALVLTGG